MSAITVVKTSAVKEVGSADVVISIGRLDGKKGKSDSCAVVPAFSINTMQAILNDSNGAAWLTDCVNGLRSKIATALHRGGKAITTESIALTAVLAAMTAELTAGRMDKEAIAKWFDSELAEHVSTAIAAKMPGIAADKLSALVAGYSEAFQSMSRAASIEPALQAQLLKALALLPDDNDHPLSVKMLAKVEGLEAPKVTISAL